MEQSTVDNPAPPQPAKRISPRSLAVPREQRDQARDLFLAGLKPDAIAAKTGLSQILIGVWSRRYKWTKARATAQDVIARIQVMKPGREATPAIADGSNRVRALLAAEVEAQAQALQSVPPSLESLPNRPTGQGRASVAKTIAETAAAVFDWESQHTPGIVVIGEIERDDPEEQQQSTIDISSESISESIADNVSITSSTTNPE